MKTKDFDSFSGLSSRNAKRSRRGADGPGFGVALAAIACVIGVFGLLTVLYHFG